MSWSLLVAVVFLPIFVLADHKGVSGGNGFNGTLLERTTYEGGELLQGSSVQQLLATEASAYPFLGDLIRQYTSSVESKGKNWYLDDRPLNPKCLNPITLDIRQTILACQNDVEVRIKRSWWLKAKSSERRSLLLHEILTAMRFEDGRFDTVPPAVAILLSQASPNEIGNTFARLGFGYLFTTEEVHEAGLELGLFEKLAESARNENELSRAADLYFARWCNGTCSNPYIQQLVIDSIKTIKVERLWGSDLGSSWYPIVMWHAWWDEFLNRAK